jgi:hypothetical protein
MSWNTFVPQTHCPSSVGWDRRTRPPKTQSPVSESVIVSLDSPLVGIALATHSAAVLELAGVCGASVASEMQEVGQAGTPGGIVVVVLTGALVSLQVGRLLVRLVAVWPVVRVALHRSRVGGGVAVAAPTAMAITIFILIPALCGSRASGECGLTSTLCTPLASCFWLPGDADPPFGIQALPILVCRRSS